MAELVKQQSNPFSTGGGGPNFETRVQAAFTVLMLTGRLAPCLPPFPITKIKLQGRYTGFNTDDFIVFSKHPETEKEAKLLAQIKHDISITAKNTTFAEVIQSTWNDFNDENFDSNTDALALITGPLSATDINDVRPILEWARHSEDEKEFFAKINTADFSSDAKRTKLEAFKMHLKTANDGTDVSPKELWEFLKVFHIIGYDLDTESGGTLSLLYALIAQYSNESALSLWARVVNAVQIANQNAGTINLETLPEDIRTVFSTVNSSNWLSDVSKLKEHGNYILGGIRTTVGGIHIQQSDAFAQLLSLTEASSFVFVSGERGTGKSSLVREFSDFIGERAPIFCLRTEDLEQPHLDNVFSAMGLRGSLRDLEAGFALMPKKYLIIESLEKLLELEKTTAFTDLLHLLKKQQGWTVIATGRDYAYQQISFNYLQPSEVSFETLTLSGFNDDQVQNLCEQLKPLQKLSDNPTLKLLLKSPFFADLAYRVLQTGTVFTLEDGEKEFRIAVWREVIAKEKVRANGMPLKRRQAFINIAVNRAKQMVYGVPETEFDSDAVFKLEEDNLVRRDSKNSLVSPAHDVLEDWALDQYIEDAYRKHSSNIQDFLDAIGNEPAMNRAFRLWLHQKLRYGENVDDFVNSVLSSLDIQRYWQDETIAAVLQGENPDEFLRLLKNQLFLKNGELLKRFCFILRIACQTPDQTLASKIKENNESALVDAIFLKPYGQGWKAIICFLFENRNSLSEGLTPHITAVLNDWSSLLNLNEDLLAPAREAGLLALHLLAPLKESYGGDSDRKSLLSIIIKTISVISEEFLELLEIDIFTNRVDERPHQPNYVKEFCEMAFQGIEAAFFCKHAPDTLMKLAYFEWLIGENIEDDNPFYRSSIDVAECFGLHEFKYKFSPASGEQGPFKYLLYYHSRKGLDFVLNLLNITANEYAHSNLDSPSQHNILRTGYSEPLVEQVEIQLNDGLVVRQYCSIRLWAAYRGYSVIPYLLQSALMALENWLIAYTEYSESEQLEVLFDYILRHSNSVMPTAVLASVATGFPEKVGKFALPLLRIPELYDMDLRRFINEQGGNEMVWHLGFQRDALSKRYSEERRTAALRPWRKEHLESLIVRLQFLKWKDEALAALDLLRMSEPQDETMRFRLHRIDSRGWRTVEDKENNRIMFEPEGLESDLKDIQQQAQESMQEQNRFSMLSLWARRTFKREPLESDYYATWHEALAEAKELFEELNSGAVSVLKSMYFCAIVTTAAISVRDHLLGELNEEDTLWCIELISQAVTANADTEDSFAITDVTDNDGAAAGASVLPILLDFTNKENEEPIADVNSLIATALMHPNQNVRHSAADGIRKYLWQRDAEFAQKCIIGSLEYARFELDRNTRSSKRRRYSPEDVAKKVEVANLQARKDEFRARFARGALSTDLEYEVAKKVKVAKLKAKKDDFRDRFVRGELSTDFEEITLQSHSSWHVLSFCLMIPDGSRDPSHIKLLSKMLALFFKNEREDSNDKSARDARLNINYEIRSSFTERFATYLFYLYDSNFQPYLELLQMGCEIAPNFMNSLILQMAVVAERADKSEIYWRLWKELSPKLQEIAIEAAGNNSDYGWQGKRRKLVRGILQADITWQKFDYENQNIAIGKDLLLEFVTNAGKNPDVFEALASLMYHFPSIFFESGIHILSKHQRDEGGIRLLSRNTAFYLERAIQRFLQLDQTGPLSRTMHQSCFVLLNAIVETASSRAYYLREHLIRSRKIV
jgi:hypothetical protein